MANKNSNLGAAKTAKNDEFYTQYEDIEREMNAYLEYDENVFRGKTVLLPCDDPEWSNFTKYFAQNFERFGLKKLISTSYAPESKKIKAWEPTLFETEAPQYDEDKSKTHGKIFILDSDTNGSGRIDVNDLRWEYLEGDGDFRSEEVTKLRDEADFIITNPPFSLFREFIDWLMAGEKLFAVIGNQNAITYKEIFPLIKEDIIWWGANDCLRWFVIPDAVDIAFKHNQHGERIAEGARSRWFTNIDHGRRHQPLQLMTMADNIKYSKHKEIRGIGYYHYDNFNAIEVPFTDAIPSDYYEWMGVPITFLDKYNPEQFEIIGIAKRGPGDPALRSKFYTASDYPNYNDLNATPVIITDGIPHNTYPRILIRKK